MAGDPQHCPFEPDLDWVAEQVAKFTPEDLQRVAEVLRRIARDQPPV
ncbi:MAG: hypothetical protein ACLPXZ_00450 [Mycobacterium sp.]